MTKYSWDINELLIRREFLNRQLKIYEELLEVYEGLVENYSKKYSQDERIEVSCTLSGFHQLKQDFEQISKEKLDLLLPSIDVVTPYNAKLVEPKFTHTKFSDKDLVDMTRALFKKLPNKYFLEKYDEFTNPEKCLLHIRNYRTLPTTSFGLTFTDAYDHVSYGLVSRHNSIQDIITLAHEIFHMIIRENEELFYKETNKPIYVEVEGYFANLLFSEMLKNENITEVNELNRFNERDLTTTIATIRECFIIVKAFEIMTKKGIIDFDVLKDILREKNIFTPINNDNFNGLVNEELLCNVNNSTSYLVALDLFENYKLDPEKTFANLQSIPQLPGDNPKKDLESIDVTFFEDRYINLEKQCKKLLKKRNTTSK